MFHTVLVANRGEIAVRAQRTLRRLGVRSAAVYSPADRNSEHVRMADVAVALGGDKPRESYASIEGILSAALETGAQAIFPGYGFLSESAELAEACAAAGIVFIGPTPVQLRDFGLKHRARQLATAAGVPLAPGSELLSDVDQALIEASGIGYPVMLKSTAGGGGIGLTRCEDAAALKVAFERVQRLGSQYFGDAGVFLERFVDRARHIEVQVFGDGKGRVVALGERDCSVQRRNQKVLEETPAPHLPSNTRARLLDAATALARSVSYQSAGTVEFVYDAERDEFYFLEVNTRLQVEHPVTEAVTGLDLVEQMLRLASGDELDFASLERSPRGAAIEARLYAEDPLKQFQPSPGVLTEVSFPEGVRVDGWISTGTEVPSCYDPLLAKLIVHGKDRAEALARLRRALSETRLYGIATNLELLRQVAQSAAFSEGNVSTRLLDDFVYAPPVVEVLEPGTYTTVQDHPGRLGYWNIGVPPSGPMDDRAFCIANRIVGNAPDAAGLECTLEGPSLRFHTDAIVALTGASSPATLDGAPVGAWQPITVRKGQTLRVGRAQSGCRMYVAIQGGIDVPRYLGSRSTFALGQFGGHAGRTLRSGDTLTIFAASASQDEPRAASPSIVPSYGSEWDIGVLYGPHGAPDFFTEDSLDELFSSTFEVHYNSNRLGVRLTGPKPRWARSDGGEAGLHPSNIHDCEYAVGSVNFTGDSPVILTHDGPSLGGFVCPFTIAQAELWKVGQVKPGDRIRFRRITYEQAVTLQAAADRLVESLGHPDTNRADDAPRLEETLALSSSSPTSPTVDERRSQRPPASSRHSPAILAELPSQGSRPQVTYREAGDSYVLLEYGPNVLDLGLRMRVHLLMEALERAAIPGVEEISPGVRSLQIRYDSRKLRQQTLLDQLLSLELELADVATLRVPTRIVHLPLAFEDSATLGAVTRYRETVRAQAPWLPNNVEFIRRINGLESVDDVKRVVFSASYMVLGLGDVYLGAPCAVPIDPRHRLLTSKYNPARTFTAEGTVGIGGVYMCIYGMDSPGGYQLVGRTLPIWNKFLKNRNFEPGAPWLLRFFDQVRFYPVSEGELLDLRESFREGRSTIEIEEEDFDFAAHTRFLEENRASIASFKQRQELAFRAEVSLWQAEQPVALPAPPDAEAVGTPEDGHVVTADVSGSLWKVLVDIGQRVDAGTALVVVEAMKMELSIEAPISGTVKAIRCQPGRPVTPGEPLLLLEPLAGGA